MRKKKEITRRISAPKIDPIAPPVHEPGRSRRDVLYRAGDGAPPDFL